MADENKSQITVKPPTTHIEQVNILKSRGLIFGVELIRLGMPYQWKQFLDKK